MYSGPAKRAITDHDLGDRCDEIHAVYLPDQVKVYLINLKVQIQTDFQICLMSGMLSLKKNYKDIVLICFGKHYSSCSSLWKSFDIAIIIFYLKSSVKNPEEIPSSILTAGLIASRARSSKNRKENWFSFVTIPGSV